MSAEPIYLLMAREVTTDGNDQMNSIIKIIDRFGVGLNTADSENIGHKPGTPILAPINYAVASSWIFSKPTKKNSPVGLELTIVDPSGALLGSQTQEVEVESPTRRLSLNFNMQGLIVTTTGEYTLRASLQYEGKSVATAEYPYEVQVGEESTK